MEMYGLRGHNLFEFAGGSGPSFFQEANPQDEAKAGGQKVLERRGRWRND